MQQERSIVQLCIAWVSRYYDDVRVHRLYQQFILTYVIIVNRYTCVEVT
jgi:hypothetical protein